MYPTIQLNDSQVGNSATYTFTLTRIFDGQLTGTNWINEPVASDANTTIIFPE